MEPNQSGVIKAVCISEKKGTAKKNIGKGRLIVEHGFENDAHAGNWHRQVSLLSHEKVEAFKERGGCVKQGDFGENLLVSGIELAQLPVGTKLRTGDVLLEVTQIGKECHAHCEIYKQVGDCIMPREGIFARVLEGGEVAEGDVIGVVDYSNFKND